MCSHIFCSLFYSHILLHIFCPGDHRRGTPAVGPQVVQGPGPTTLFVGAHELCCSPGTAICIKVIDISIYNMRGSKKKIV